MSETTTGFFEDLGKRGHEPLLARANGTIRFDLKNGRTGHWLVTIKKGDVTVSQQNASADCVIQADRGVFEEIVNGNSSAMAAALRGALRFEGEPELLVLFQRLFGASNGKKPQPAGKVRRQR